jgi:DNA-binding FadR family transcriptional regulator
VRQVLEQLCMKLVIEQTTDEQLAGVAPLLEAIDNADTPERAAEAVYNFHHELAVLSGNMLLPLMYHSFKPESIHLWSWFVRHNGAHRMYEIKLELYRALLNRDTEAAITEPGEYPNESWWYGGGMAK